MKIYIKTFFFAPPLLFSQYFFSTIRPQQIVIFRQSCTTERWTPWPESTKNFYSLLPRLSGGNWMIIIRPRPCQRRVTEIWKMWEKMWIVHRPPIHHLHRRRRRRCKKMRCQLVARALIQFLTRPRRAPIRRAPIRRAARCSRRRRRRRRLPRHQLQHRTRLSITTARRQRRADATDGLIAAIMVIIKLGQRTILLMRVEICWIMKIV